MLGRHLAYVLAGLGAPVWAAPVLPRADTPSPVLSIKGTPTNGECIPITWNGVFICLSPPTTTIGPSTRRNIELEALAERDNPSPTTTDPTPTDGKTCAIWQGVIICWEPPKTTMWPSGKRNEVDAAEVEKKDITEDQNGGGWGGGGLIPDTPIPGGPLIPGPYLPGQPITPDPTYPGGEVAPST